MEEESRAVSWRHDLGVMVCLYLICAAQKKCFCYSKIIIFIFWHHCDSVVRW